jgi:hypothetical protein
MNSKFGFPSGAGRSTKSLWRLGWSVGIAAVCGGFIGCQSAPVQTSVYQRDFRPDNVFVYPPKLSLNLQRVAILPLATASQAGDLPEGCEALAPVLWEQLVKLKRFEAVAVDATKLRAATGRSAWTGAEVLPVDFFTYLRREYGCDAVLFGELTTYRAYAPLAVGWRFKLVDAHSGQILWAADELFDASQPAIAKAAGHFEQKKPVWPALPAAENWVALNSPRRFGRYSAAALLDTLPEH